MAGAGVAVARDEVEGRTGGGLLHVSDVAHMQFSGGGLVMPADSPYDRQLLREHVQTLIQPGSPLQLRLRGNEWTVTRLSGVDPCCTACA